MTRGQSFVAWGIVVAGLAGGLLLAPGLGGDDGKTPPPEALLPAGAIAYVGWDGTDAHREAWQKTAAYKTLFESGLADLVTKVVRWGEEESGVPAARLVTSSMAHVLSNGVYLAAGVSGAETGRPMPHLTIVAPRAASAVQQFAQLVHEHHPGEFRDVDVQGRKVTRGLIRQLPGLEIGFWAEGSHLVIVAGIGAVDAAIAVAAGKAPAISTNEVWKKYRSPAEFETALTAWLDLAAVRELVAGLPIPAQGGNEPATVGEVLKALGLEKLGPLAFRLGFRDDAIWSQTTLEAPAPREGLLAFADGAPISLGELPALPAETDGFYAGRLDWSKAYDGIVRIAGVIMKRFGPPDAPSIEQFVAQAEREIGVNLKGGLFDPLGDLMVFYGDTGQGLLGMGIGLAISLDDAKTLRASVEKLLARLAQEAGDDVFLKRSAYGSRTVHYLEFPQAPVVSPALVVDDKWLAIGLYPQTVNSFLLRLDGKLAAWKPSDEVSRDLAELPAKYQSLTVSDPRSGIKTVLSLAPIGLSAAQAAMADERRRSGGRPVSSFPVTVADFPPSELVTGPLFVNLSVCSVDDAGIRWTSRSSLPAVPLVGGAGVGSGAGAAPVLVALLLPAVQQARTAARRTQSSNNLRQIGLALHNFHDAHQAFPAGTHQNDRLKAEKRLSWQVDILPYLDQSPLYERIDLKKAWDEKPNAELLKNRLPMLLNPGISEVPVEYAPTHYVGMAGVGKDAFTLPITDRRAGVFGYNRITRIQNITDGTSNTIGVTEASKDFGPWGAGGKSSIRALTTKPYINGPDGIGGPYPGGMNALLMDGSVRFISESIDPGVLEALTTISGRESVSGF